MWEVRVQSETRQNTTCKSLNNCVEWLLTIPYKHHLSYKISYFDMKQQMNTGINYTWRVHMLHTAESMYYMDPKMHIVHTDETTT